MLWARYIFIFTLVLSPSLSYSDMNDFAESYLGKIESNGGAVFFSRCKSRVNDQYTALLIFEAGSTKGFLIEKAQGFVVNLATVGLGNSGLIIEETHGGVFSYERVKKLADELGGYRFHLLAPFRVKELEETRPTDICSNGG